MNRKKLSAIIEIMLIVLLAGILLYGAYGVYKKAMTREGNRLEEARLVLYEGPASLKDAGQEDLKNTSEDLRDFSLMHCVDTQITVNGYECYVYDTNVNHTRVWVDNYLPPISRTPVAYFDFEGQADIQITIPDKEIISASISPETYGIEPDIKGEHSISFSVTEPGAYTVMINETVERAIHIFANPLETEVPDFNDENVIYIGPGEWNIDTINLESGQTLYLAGGAVVHGVINGSKVEDVTVMGRGILDGSKTAGWKGQVAYIPLRFDNCKNVVLQDIMVLNANAWVCQAFESENGIIDNLKIISARPNGDGITLQSCRNYQVSNCFVRSWDDSLVIKNYRGNSKNISFTDMQLWTDLAQSMEIGYETNKGERENPEISEISFENITVLHNFHKPVISVHNGDDAFIHDILFRNIIVEDARMGSGDGDEMPYLIDIVIDRSSNWSTTKERGTIQNIRIDGVRVTGGNFPASRIKGFDEEHKVEDVEIRNLSILGETIRSFEQGKFEIEEDSTRGLEIKEGE